MHDRVAAPKETHVDACFVWFTKSIFELSDCIQTGKYDDKRPSFKQSPPQVEESRKLMIKILATLKGKDERYIYRNYNYNHL